MDWGLYRRLPRRYTTGKRNYFSFDFIGIMEIYVIRHTTPYINKGICYGQSDIPVANTFEEEWQRIKQNLPTSIDIIYSSPLSRCASLASKICHHYTLPVSYDTRLKELNFGDWELTKWNDIDSTSLQTWMDDYINVRCPRGESYLDLVERVQNFLTELQSENYENAIVVTHHGVMKAMFAIMNNVDLEEAMKTKFQFGEIVRLTGI